MSGCSQEMREKNPKLARKFEKQFGEDIFDRVPRPPENFFRRRPKKPNFDIEKSWWGIIKSVPIDFAMVKEGRAKNALGWYNPATDEITINLYPYRKGHRGGEGKRTVEMTDQDFIDEIIETITHEAGHAAALSEQGANLMRELDNWALDVVFRNIDVNNPTQFQEGAAPFLHTITSYLVNEYIADLIAGKDKDKALQNAWEQVVIAKMDEWIKLLLMGYREEDDKVRFRVLTNQIIENVSHNPFEIIQELMPLLDKHFNKINQLLFKVYQTGISRTIQSNWEQYADEGTKEEFGIDFPFKGKSKREEFLESRRN